MQITIPIMFTVDAADYESAFRPAQELADGIAQIESINLTVEDPNGSGDGSGHRLYVLPAVK